MDLLKDVDTLWVEPTISVVNNDAYLRDDALQAPLSSPSELLDCSEQKVVSWQIVLPNIMN